MVAESLGLQTSLLTWYLAAGLLAVWVLSLFVLVGLRPRWHDLVMNVRGLAWLGFGLGIISRYFLLATDAESFSSPSLHLLDRPSHAVDLALVTAAVYWGGVVVASLAGALVPMPRRAGDDDHLAILAPATAIAGLLVTTICVVLSQRPGTPGELVTPLGVAGSMWVVPAAAVWIRWFRRDRVPLPMLALTLVPGAVRLVLNPYREQIVELALVLLCAAIFSGRRVRLSLVAGAMVVLLLVSTVAVSAYRKVLWGGEDVDEVMSTVSATEWAKTSDGPWLQIVRRFHVLESLLLTVDLVPDVFPYSDRNILLEGATRGIVPRLLLPGKVQSDEGLRFQTTIWAYYNDPTAEDATASIAPSMPGSLFEAGGLLVVAAGGLLWGLLLALVDRAKSHMVASLALGLHLLCALHALAGIERDFAFAFATMTQTLLVFSMLYLATRRTGALTVACA